jgi:hypothetical protein
MTLAEVGEKIKSAAAFLTRKDVYAALIIVFVGLASFCLGALWQRDRNRPDVNITNADMAAFNDSNIAQEPNGQGSTTDAYVGSYTSKIYRLTTCPGVSAINPDNRVYFASQDDAVAAGYIAAKNCKM